MTRILTSSLQSIAVTLCVCMIIATADTTLADPPVYNPVSIDPFAGSSAQYVQFGFVDWNDEGDILFLVKFPGDFGPSDTAFGLFRNDSLHLITRANPDWGRMFPMRVSDAGDVLTWVNVNSWLPGGAKVTAIYDSTFQPVMSPWDPTTDTCTSYPWLAGGYIINSNRDIFGAVSSVFTGNTTFCTDKYAFWAAGSNVATDVFKFDTLLNYGVDASDMLDVHAFNEQNQALVEGERCFIQCATLPPTQLYICEYPSMSITELQPPPGISPDSGFRHYVVPDTTYAESFWAQEMGNTHRVMNNSGWVVGGSTALVGGSRSQRACLWRNGVATVLDTSQSIDSSMAYDVSDNGHVLVTLWTGTLPETKLWYQDSLYTLGEIIVGYDQFVHTGGEFRSGKTFILNSAGDILVLTTGITAPEWIYEVSLPPGSPVVNSTGDGVDINPGDSVCSTGNTIFNGDDECTLCAAIQEANARAGRDFITFDIPGGGVPEITLTKALPAITESVVIDASTQADSGRVLVNGALVPGAVPAAVVDGLTIRANNTEVRGLSLRGFSGNGIAIISADSVRLMANVIGDATSNDTLYSNAGFGVYIDSSSDARIGDADYANANIIRDNRFAGIYVASGAGNTFRRNVIFDNGGLAIDLAPLGVNFNDSADVDFGPNRLENYPIIDSVVMIPLQTRIYGHIQSEPGYVHIVEVFFNDSCDASGLGGGQESKFTTTANSGGSDIAPFAAVFAAELDSAQVISLTATDQDGNTSEFSPCWPNKVIRLSDQELQPISNKKFSFSRVRNNPPNMTEVFIDSLTTDADGLIDITSYRRSGAIKTGDSLRFARHLGIDSVYGNRYSVSIDNADFDSVSYALAYPECNDAPDQTIYMTHGTFAFPAHLRFEWAAHPDYWTETELSMRTLANYMYDVTDGQFVIDTVWLSAPNQTLTPPAQTVTVNVLADNIAWPTFTERAAGFAPKAPSIGRRWFGRALLPEDLSANEYPLLVSGPVHYRALAAALASGWVSFKSEVTFPEVCNYDNEMGFMALPVPTGAGAFSANISEMSWSRNYQNPLCQGTPQYRYWRASCWDHLEVLLEKTYDGIPVPVIKPSERTLVGGTDYFEGPNNNLASLDYDVGSEVVFPRTVAARSERDIKYRLKRPSGEILHNAFVSLVKNFIISTQVLRQGVTSTQGEIWILGAGQGDIVRSSGSADQAVVSRQAASTVPFSWFYGQSAVDTTAGDTAELILQEVFGSYPLVCDLVLDSAQLQFDLAFESAFSVAPDLEYRLDSATTQTVTLTTGPTSYSTTISGYDTDRPLFTVTAPDDSANQFFFELEYTERVFEDTLVVYLQDSYRGNASVSLDSLNVVRKMGILSSPYPVVATGLGSENVQVSSTHALSVFPDPGTLPGANDLRIAYKEVDTVTARLRAVGYEESIRVFRWSSGNRQWELVGGTADTNLNTVSVAITQPGVYAAFTTQNPTAVGDGSGDGILPSDVALEQNVPNPFNPTTTIEYSLPKPAEVSIEVYNILGQHVVTLQDGSMSAGVHSVMWNGMDRTGSPVASGVYFYRIDTGEQQAVRRMLLLK